MPANQNDSGKKLLGRVYTPDFIVDKILQDTGYINAPTSKSILDPACGDGQFLAKIVHEIIRKTNRKGLKNALSRVYGWDIDENAIELCKNRLDAIVEPLNIGPIHWNILHLDSLNQLTYPGKFDYIVGNPPYIRIQNLPKNTRDFLKKNLKFCSKGSTDIYIAFFEIASILLSDTGICAFITPNSYFVSDTAYRLRKYFEREQNLKKITNFKNEQVFEDASTYSAITIFGKSRNTDFLYEESDKVFSFTGKTLSFNHLNGRKFWYLTLSDEFLVTKEGQRLGDICQISVGIATLADRVYIVKKLKESGNQVFVQNKLGTKFSVEKSILRPIIKASKLKSDDLTISEYIIYPYISNKYGKSEIIEEPLLQSKFPLTYSYFNTVKAILNERDNNKVNPIAWYAFGRTQSMDTSVGEKIVFSPMKKKPNFIVAKNPEGLVYSGYYIKFDGDYQWLADKLNSKEMEDYLDVTGRYFSHGWRGITKKVLQDFIIS